MNKIPHILKSFQLKLFALVSMSIDHICLILFPDSPAAYALRMTIGRMAMPIFAFLACEAFFHTRNRKAYLRNLLIFAIISEPLYDLAKYNTLYYPADQNVLFSIFAGVLLLCILNIEPVSTQIYYQAAITIVFMLAAWIFCLDYDFCAIALIAIFYKFHWHNLYISGFLATSLLTIAYETPGVYLSLIPILLYNGLPGGRSSAKKYLFYVFYPSHLVILHIFSKIVF